MQELSFNRKLGDQQEIFRSHSNLFPLPGELQKGTITEIIGTRSSGKTSLILSALARATEQFEFAAIIDPTDSFDPYSAQIAGIELSQILWVRCRASLEPALKSADHILHAGGFGIVVLDLADVRPDIVSRIPQSYWYRFRLAAENTTAAFLLISPIPCAGSSCCSSLEVFQRKAEWTGSPGHRLLESICPEIQSRKMPKMLRAGRVGPGFREIPLEKRKSAACR